MFVVVDFKLIQFCRSAVALVCMVAFNVFLLLLPTIYPFANFKIDWMLVLSLVVGVVVVVVKKKGH